MPVTVLIVISSLIVVLLLFLWLQPEWVIASLQQSSPEVLYAVNTNEPVIALTIDDGPDSESSPMIMDLLRRYNA